MSLCFHACKFHHAWSGTLLNGWALLGPFWLGLSAAPWGSVWQPSSSSAMSLSWPPHQGTCVYRSWQMQRAWSWKSTIVRKPKSRFAWGDWLRRVCKSYCLGDLELSTTTVFNQDDRQIPNNIYHLIHHTLVPCPCSLPKNKPQRLHRSTLCP